MDFSTNIPEHIAIIMDGNRRWAKKRGLSIIKGHEEGSNTLEKILEAASKLGVKTLTVYALSTENLKERNKTEVLGLFNLIRKNFQTRVRKIIQNNIKVYILGEINGFPSPIRKIIEKTVNLDPREEKMRLNIALNYGGKMEIVQAVKKIVEKKIKPEEINEQTISDNLYTKGQKDPELFIRTGGKVRTSNFLLWQTAYSELYFTDTLWPDFSAKELKKAIAWYQMQQRNFGK